MTEIRAKALLVSYDAMLVAMWTTGQPKQVAAMLGGQCDVILTKPDDCHTDKYSSCFV